MGSIFWGWKSLVAKLGITWKERRLQSRRSTSQLRFEPLEPRQMLTIVVDNPLDERDFEITNDVSLRDAIEQAAVGETINFAPSLNGAKIDLLPSLGEIAFNKSLTIDASALANGITIDAKDPTPTQKNSDGIRIFNITGGDVTLKNMTLQGGDVSAFQNGGAIRAVGDVSLVLEGITVRDSAANYSGRGGGLYFETLETTVLPTGQVEPRLVIRDSSFKDNIAQDGGGVLVNLGGHVGDGDHVQALDQKVLIETSQFLSNTAQGRGGGLALWQGAGGEVELVNSALSGNLAGVLQNNGLENKYLNDSGGGVYAYLFSGDELPGGIAPGNRNNDGVARFVITGSTIDENDAGSYGGGVAVCAKREDSNLAVRSQVEIINSTITSNQVLRNGSKPGELGILGKGGGVALAIYPNDANEGLDSHFQNVTVTKNRGLEGGGIWSMVPSRADGRNRTWLTNTIVSDNAELDPNVPDNLHGSFDIVATKYNLIGTGSSAVSHLTPLSALTTISPAPFDSTNLFTDNPGLSALAFSGGPTKTHAPQFGSPAIDAGDPNFVGPPDTDQRGTGFVRVFDGDGMGGAQIDIGAHEVGLAKVIDVVLDNPNPAVWSRDPHSFAQAIPLGEQLRPFATQYVNTVQIRFSDAILKKPANGGVPVAIGSGGAEGDLLMELKRTIRTSSGGVINETVLATNFVYDSNTKIATWTFAPPADGGVLLDGKYAIHLKAPIPGVAGIVDAAGNALDAEWDNAPGGKPDLWETHPGRPLVTGNGTAGSTNDEFRFHFAILAGDYDGDGMVELGAESATGDGNGDNFVNANDTNIGLIGTLLPLKELGGADFNDDERNDGVDLTMWQTGYDDQMAGDADGDGDVDGRDFLVWLRTIGTYSAWGDPPSSSFATAFAASLGLTLEDLTVGLTPQVLNVIISGSQSLHTPFSFDTVDGSGSQLATVPVGGADTISIVFSENVNVSANSLIVVGLTTANVPQVAEFNYDASTYTATWRFEGWALGDNYLLHLKDSITDTEGNFLDGEWTNPASISTTNPLVSTFPSGDGVSGGTFQFVMTLLPGDYDLDGQVTGADYAIFGITYNLMTGQIFTTGDYNGDGAVDYSDFSIAAANLNTNLQNIVILADLNADGRVDDYDLNVIIANYSMTGATLADGDLDGDGQVGDSDLDLAFAQYGLDFDWVA